MSGSRLWIKICGLTHPADAAGLAGLGVDAAGLNFWAPGKRFVAPGRDVEVAAALPAGVQKVGVFVDAPAREVLATVERVGLDAVQLHGAPDAALLGAIAAAGVEVWQAVRLRGLGDLAGVEGWPPGPVLIDAWAEALPGGTGRRLDLALAAQARDRLAAAGRRTILAGGLDSETVGGAVRAVRPFGVDVASGVERSDATAAAGGAPPRKDLGAVARFVTGARAASET